VKLGILKNGFAQGEESNDGASAEIVRPCRQQAFAAVAESSLATNQSSLRAPYDRLLVTA
jgi:hypothetical protein